MLDFHEMKDDQTSNFTIFINVLIKLKTLTSIYFMFHIVRSTFQIFHGFHLINMINKHVNFKINMSTSLLKTLYCNKLNYTNYCSTNKTIKEYANFHKVKQTFY
jgi:hypothetical protein